jgi:hypothetical protein
MIDIAPRDTFGLIVAIAGATALAFVLYRHTSPTLPLRMRAALGVVRWFAAMIVLLLVIDPRAGIVRTDYRNPVIAVLVDDSRSMALPEPDTKIEAVKRVLSSDFIDRLESRADLRFYAFSGGTVEITPDQLGSLEPVGSRTDLAQGIRTVLDELSVPPSGFIVFTDGAVNFGEDVLNLASTLRSPVDVVGLLQESPTPDISLDKVEVTETAYANTEVPVSLLVSAKGTGPVDVSLAISDSMGTVFSRQVFLAGTGAKTKVEAVVDAGEIGSHDFTVELGGTEAEKVVSNNSGIFSLNVIKGKIRVVMIAPGPSWDFAFAKRSLMLDPNIEVFSLFTSPAAARPKVEGVVPNLSSISDLDVAVVFGGHLPADIAADLRESVRDGTGLVLLLGPDAVALDPDLSPFTLTADGRRGSLLVGVAPTPVGEDHEILRLAQAAGTFSWSDLPPVPVNGSVAGRPEATVLLMGKVERVEVPVLAIMRYGQGRIVGLAAYDLWRWDLIPKGFGLEASPFSQMLLNSIGWLAERDEVRRLSLSASKRTYLAGEPVDLFARAVDENLKPVEGVLLEGDVRNQETGEVSSSFTMTERGGGSHFARIDYLPPGTYRAHVVGHLGGDLYGEEAVDFAIDRRGLEDYGYDGDAVLLRQISRLTGGSFYYAAEAGSLAEMVKPGMVIVKTYGEIRLPLNLIVFLLLAVLLGTEWWLRKRRMLL